MPAVVAVMIFLALLFMHAALTHFFFNARMPVTARKDGCFKSFLACLCVLFFGYIFTTCIYDICSSTSPEMFSFLYTIIPTYMDFTREYVYASFDTISALTTTLLLVCLASIYYTVMFTAEGLTGFITYLSTIYLSGVYFLFAKDTASVFVAYEFLLLPSSIMIDKFSKTVRAREASQFMVVWTQIGAITLFTVLYMLNSGYGDLNVDHSGINFNRTQANVIMLLTFFGFGTKMPVWPFYWWLPEAHVEVTTSFSIVLSGVSIKFAFLGFIRFVGTFGAGDLYWIFCMIAMLGFLDAVFKGESETDIKKIVAYQTVAEMHVLVLYVCLDYSAFIDFVYFMFPTHCWISTLSFILVDIIAKRYHSRNLEHLYGIFQGSPLIVKFIYMSVFMFGSMPGTAIFTVEFYTQIAGATSAFNILMFVFFQFALALFTRNIWWILCGGDMLYFSQAHPFTMTRSEMLFMYILLIQLIPAMATVEILY